MRRTKQSVRLTDEERAALRTLVGRGVAPARLLTHARILLKADQGEGRAMRTKRAALATPPRINQSPNRASRGWRWRRA